MKTLKELKKNCTLIAEFRQPAFVVKHGYTANWFDKANMAAIYYDEKKYYVYKRITDTNIEEFNTLNEAIDIFNRFIKNVVEN